MTPSIKSQALEILAAAENVKLGKSSGGYFTKLHPDTIAHLMRTLLKYEEALEKIAKPAPDSEVPDLDNENEEEYWFKIAQARKKIAREALEGKTE